MKKTCASILLMIWAICLLGENSSWPGKVDRDVINLVDKQKVEFKSFVLENLTHQAFIIQLTRIPESPENQLEKLLSLFNQKWRADDGFKPATIMKVRGIAVDEIVNHIGLDRETIANL